MNRVLILGLLFACKANVHQSPRCAQERRQLVCEYNTTELSTGLGTREVHHQIPIGDPPPDGFPVVLLFQGALFSGEGMWQARQKAALGAYHQTRTVEILLQNGYAVITPEAAGDGLTAWNTNLPPHAKNWDLSPDHALMTQIFEGIEEGLFGPLDIDARYAAGISSGGYMTSRMTTAFPGEFRALAIHSASWQTCAGAVCSVPDVLPSDHPPTLFLHGGFDGVVPSWTSKSYSNRLAEQGIEVSRQDQPFRSHRWLDVAPDAILGWFQAHGD